MFKKILDKIKDFIPAYSVIPLLFICLLNSFVYWGGDFLARNRIHYDFTMPIDRMVPIIPVFVWIYVLAFPFWCVNYILVSWRGKKTFYRFVATDITIHLICFVLFVILPTTNLRPNIENTDFSTYFLNFLYSIDGGENPSNLFPSIHCYVSWMCYICIAGSSHIPKLYQKFSKIFAILIIVSTQVLKQHYLLDAVVGITLVEIFWNFYGKESRYYYVERIFTKINKFILGLIGKEIKNEMD